MQLSVLAQAFFDGFGLTGLFSKAQRPGVPEFLFTQDPAEQPKPIIRRPSQ